MASLPLGFPAMAMGASQQQQQFAASNGSGSHPDDDEMIDAIEQILSAEENRKIQAASLSACRAGASPIPGGANGEPLMANELSILSLLCTKAAGYKQTTTTNRTAPNGGNIIQNHSQGPIGFGAVDGDLLSTLTELLEKHVNQAVGVDLVKEAVSVIHKRETKIDQVRAYIIIISFFGKRKKTHLEFYF
jgi:hypothetical protein